MPSSIDRKSPKSPQSPKSSGLGKAVLNGLKGLFGSKKDKNAGNLSKSPPKSPPKYSATPAAPQVKTEMVNGVEITIKGKNENILSASMTSAAGQDGFALLNKNSSIHNNAIELTLPSFFVLNDGNGKKDLSTLNDKANANAQKAVLALLKHANIAGLTTLGDICKKDTQWQESDDGATTTLFISKPPLPFPKTTEPASILPRLNLEDIAPANQPVVPGHLKNPSNPTTPEFNLQGAGNRQKFKPSLETIQSMLPQE